MSRVRGVAAVVLLVVAALLVPVAATAVWARAVVVDTTTYLGVVGPLADDTRVQDAVSDAVSDAVLKAVDIGSIVDEMIDGADLSAPTTVALNALRGAFAQAAEQWVRDQVHEVVTSPTTAQVWREVNGTLHTQMIGVLRGDPDAIAVLDDEGTLALRLDPFVTAARDRLLAAGIASAERIPTTTATVPLVTNAHLLQARTAFRLLDAVGTWLPWVALAVLAGAVALGGGRRGTWRGAGIAVLVGAGASAGAIVLARRAVLGSSSPAAEAVYDAVTGPLATALWLLAAVGLALVVVTVLVGRRTPAPAADDGAGASSGGAG
jgi:hypothetical protein